MNQIVFSHRRIADPRTSSNTRPWDIAILQILWVQLALGLTTIAFSRVHLDSSVMEHLACGRVN